MFLTVWFKPFIAVGADLLLVDGRFDNVAGGRTVGRPEAQPHLVSQADSPAFES